MSFSLENSKRGGCAAADVVVLVVAVVMIDVLFLA